MSDIIEQELWENGIYRLETTDPVEGGEDGVDNLPHKQLAARTKWLKAQLDKYALLTGSTFTGLVGLNNNIFLAGKETGGTVRSLLGIDDDNEILIGGSVIPTNAREQWNFTTHLPKSNFTPTEDTHLINKKYFDEKVTSLDDFLNSKSTNGYQKLPGGIIIQWGNMIMNDAEIKTFIYPLTFPNEILSFSVTAQAQVGQSVNEMVTQAKTVTNSSMECITERDHGSGTDNNIIRFILIGY